MSLRGWAVPAGACGRWRIAVPDGPGAFLRTDSMEVELGRGDIALDRLTLRARQIASRGAIEVAYQTALFASGYGRSYYQGFVDSIGAIGVSFPEPAARDSALVDRHRSRRRLAIGSGVVAGIAGLTAITTGFLTFDAHRDFNATSLQRPAQEARDRYDRYLPISIVSGGVAIVGVAAAWLLWPSGSVQVVPSADGPGAYSLSIGTRW